ncbi:hypothetical protein SEET0012_05604 [Salmonella enterica subsp. enterica serovar Tallahassee str. 0012]|nr:hypothetical protein SEET0012_05604 [Salmonella enterica subsp. enterica serovar Tallahassee str. 0012]
MFSKRLAVETCQQQLAQFRYQRITRVSAGALVIEGIFRQFVNVCQEVSFLYACFTDRLRNAQLSFNAFQPCQQFFNLSGGTIARRAQAQVVSNFSVTTACLRTIVLAEAVCLVGLSFAL